VGCSYLHNGFQSQPAVGSVPRFLHFNNAIGNWAAYKKMKESNHSVDETKQTEQSKLLHDSFIGTGFITLNPKQGDIHKIRVSLLLSPKI
jgi:hypothetical protein